jgi:hypothetical protein
MKLGANSIKAIQPAGSVREPIHELYKTVPRYPVVLIVQLRLREKSVEESVRS